MAINRGRKRRLLVAIETARTATVDTYQPQISTIVQQFKLDKLIEWIDFTEEQIQLEDVNLVKSNGQQLYYRYVLLLASLIENESELITIDDSFEEVFDLMNLIVAL